MKADIFWDRNEKKFKLTLTPEAASDGGQMRKLYNSTPEIVEMVLVSSKRRPDQLMLLLKPTKPVATVTG